MPTATRSRMRPRPVRGTMVGPPPPPVSGGCGVSRTCGSASVTSLRGGSGHHGARKDGKRGCRPGAHQPTWETGGSVADRGSSLTGANVMSWKRAKATSSSITPSWLRWLKRARVAVRALDGGRAERAHELRRGRRRPRPAAAPRARPGSCRTRTSAARAADVTALARGRLHTDQVRPEGALVRALEERERPRPLLGRHPAGSERQAVDPFPVVGELLPHDRIGPGLCRVDGDVPAARCAPPTARPRPPARAPRRAARRRRPASRAAPAARGRSARRGGRCAPRRSPG